MIVFVANKNEYLSNVSMQVNHYTVTFHFLETNFLRLVLAFEQPFRCHKTFAVLLGLAA